MSEEEEIQQQMEAMLADQFYHQPGPIIQIAREALVDMLAKQTLHGLTLGREEKPGLPDKDFDTFIQAMLEGESNHVEQLEQLNERQYWCMKVVDRALNRIDYKEKKNLPPILNGEE